jgi:hypothetical protein
VNKSMALSFATDQRDLNRTPSVAIDLSHDKAGAKLVLKFGKCAVVASAIGAACKPKPCGSSSDVRPASKIVNRA